jgi:hypothetical protein
MLGLIVKVGLHYDIENPKGGMSSICLSGCQDLFSEILGSA